MFERHTANARRVIFYARYEASHYGSRYIETEHLLLGLLREDGAVAKWFSGQSNAEPEIRAEIEKRITRGERIATSVETPLSDESKKVLILAAESCDRLGHTQVETEHILIGILCVEGSLAAQVLTGRGLTAAPIQEQLAKSPDPKLKREAVIVAPMVLESFLSGLQGLTSEELVAYFAEDAEFIDGSGKRWNREEMRRGYEALFAPYAKRNASYTVEAMLIQTSELVVASVLWKNALLASEQRAWIHRMSIVFLLESGEWQILLAQVTPVRPSWPAAAQSV